MNQILLQVLAQDPLKTPGVCLSFRWLLPLIPHLETIGCWFVFPLLGTGLGCLFLDIDDLLDQVFSLTGLLYVSTIISMIPKPNTSSKLWFDTNLFTVICYTLYFTELAIIAYFSLDLEYSLGWLFSITFSTIFTLLFYAILLGFGLSTRSYFKTIVSIYLLTDLGNLLALGAITPFLTDKILLGIGVTFLIYLLLPYRHPLLFSKMLVSPFQFDKNLMVLRCLFWGALAVWSDYIALTPFYILEMIMASESHQKKDSVLNYCRAHFAQHKSRVWENFRDMTNTLPNVAEITFAYMTKQKTFFKNQLVLIHTFRSCFCTRSPLFSRIL